MLELRRLTPDQWDQWRAVRLRALAEAPQAFGATLADWQGGNDVESRWRQRLVNVPFNVNAVVDDAAVGQVSAVPAELDGQVELLSLWVEPARRGHGIGEALIGAVVGWAEQRGATSVVLSVKRSNTAAVRLYERVGFVLTESSEGMAVDEQRMIRPSRRA